MMREEICQLREKISKNFRTLAAASDNLDSAVVNVPALNDSLAGSKGDSPKSERQRMKQKATFDELELAYERIREVRKAAREKSPAKKEGRVGALVDIFQARGIMPSMKPALHRKASPSSSRSRSDRRPTTPTARIVTPSGSVYLPAGTVCVPVGGTLSKSPFKRVPTPSSPFFRPSSGLSSIDTDMSELFGEKLERTGKHSVQYVEDEPYEEI
jgi:hypothetical protein